MRNTPLEQVGSCKISAGGYRLHQSIFEQDVEYNGVKHFQFDSFSTFFNIFVPSMEKIWSECRIEELKGAVCSFPYERMEVENAIVTFRDAGGGILHNVKNSRFRRCSCLGQDGKRRVCVPPKVGWACSRPAILVRSHFVLESTMLEKRRIMNERARLEDAAFAAEREAKDYLQTTIGAQAIEEFALRCVKDFELGTEIAPMSIDQIYEFDESIRSRPEMKQVTFTRTALVSLAAWSRTKKDRNDRLANEIVRVRDEYITNEVRMRRTEAQATNAKLKKVMDMWIGNKIEELFQGWKGIMIRSKIERENIRILHEKERQRMDQEENQKITVAKQELVLWEKTWDDFNDRLYWIHVITGELSMEEPTIDIILKQRNSHPHHEKTSKKWNKDCLEPIKIQSMALNQGRMDREAYHAATNVLKLRLDSLNQSKLNSASNMQVGSISTSRYLK